MNSIRKAVLIFAVFAMFVCFCSCSNDENESGTENEMEVITVGTFEQDGNYENGPEPIEWYVLAEQNGNKLILSRNILELKRYNEKYLAGTATPAGMESVSSAFQYDMVKRTSWESSSVRKWLNSEFYLTSFPDAEKEKIVQGNEPVFLLSEQEFSEFVPIQIQACEMTQYCKNSDEQIPGWMLRDLTEAEGNQYVSVVDEEGNVVAGKAVPWQTVCGVRPAMWIKAE